MILCVSRAAFSLPDGYGSIKLGMSVQEVQTELKKNSDFAYRGKRDVNLVPSTKEVLIETDATGNPYSFFERTWFQFVDGRLFSITLNLNQNKIDYYAVFSSLSKKYGEPDSINPKRASWEDETVMMSLEKPLTLKYIDSKVFNALKEESGVQKSFEEQTVEDFLNGL